MREWHVVLLAGIALGWFARLLWTRAQARLSCGGFCAWRTPGPLGKFCDEPARHEWGRAWVCDEHAPEVLKRVHDQIFDR